MTNLFSSLRTVVKERYALLTPESFVASSLPGWGDVTCVVQISPALGAKFSQTLITFGEKGRGTGHTNSDELFAFVVDGSCALSASERQYSLVKNGFAFLPPRTPFEIGNASKGTKLLLFQKRYEPATDSEPPDVLVSEVKSQSGQPFLGDRAATLQILLPDTPAFDMAVNIFN